MIEKSSRFIDGYFNSKRGGNFHMMMKPIMIVADKILTAEIIEFMFRLCCCNGNEYVIAPGNTDCVKRTRQSIHH